MVVLAVVIVLLSTACAVPARRAAARTVNRRMAEIHASTGVTLGAAAEARLRPDVVRRTAWPAVGRIIGLVVAFAGFLFVAGDPPGPPSASTLVLVGLGAGVSAAFGLAAGSLLCHVAVGYRGFTSSPGSRRTVRVDARRLSDYVAAARLRAWRCSTLALVTTLALDVALLPSVRGGRAVVVALATALALGALSLAASGLLLRRRVPGPSREELRWQEAVLADTLQLIASSSLLLDTAGVVLGLGAVLALRDELAGWGPPAGAGIVLACALAGGLLARPLLRDDQPPALGRQESTA